MKLSERIKQLRKEKGMSQQDLANVFGYKSFTTIQKWEDGSAMPPSKNIASLAEVFNISIEDLLEDREEQILVPILGTVKAGNHHYISEQWLGQEAVLASESLHGEFFYLEVLGDSMIEARIYPQDLIYVRKQNRVENGEIAVILVDEEVTVKRVFYDRDTVILHPENAVYPDRIFHISDLEEEKIKIIAKVIHVKIRL